MRYIDSVIVVVTALNNFLKSTGTFETPSNEKGVCGMGKAEPWQLGAEFFSHIMKVMKYI